MAVNFDLIGLVVADMGRSLAFYRRLGLELPPEADTQSHVEVALPGGLRIAWDTVETVRSFDPDWTPPQDGSRVSLAFRCDSPDEVDRTYDALTGTGYHGYKKPWDAFWGNLLGQPAHQ
jgi:catechol 2,3-dioxygenase-like lactoylglutathione lyase family enzyme